MVSEYTLALSEAEIGRYQMMARQAVAREGVRGHEKVPACGQVEVLAGGQLLPVIQGERGGVIAGERG